REKEALGFFISGHPLDRYREVVRAFDTCTTAKLKDRMGEPVELACVVTAVARQVSRRDGSEWGKITIEDFQGTAQVLAFKDIWQSYKETLRQDAVVLLKGKVSGRERDEDDPPIFLDSVEPLDAVPNSGRLAVQIELDTASDLTGDAFREAKAIMGDHLGGAPLEFVVGEANGVPAPRLRARSVKLAADRETIQALEAVFGKGRVGLRRL
ncbi:MAG: hypothetical protein HKN73_06370, partial [Gemmatimonadetes bacterium]|nr:hypothetical protein [Gemmatimonadota bacterium]